MESVKVAVPLLFVCYEPQIEIQTSSTVIIFILLGIPRLINVKNMYFLT